MKKIIIATVAMCMAAVVNAATANWSVSASNLYNGGGSSATKLASGMVAYVFDAGVTTQASLYEIFAAQVAIDMTTVSGYAGSTAIGTTAGVIPTSKTFGYGEQSTAETTQTYSFYFAIVDGDNIYLSKSVTKNANGSSTAAGLTFGSQAPTTGATSKSLPTEGYQGVGQWAAAPEPTSGLLLLLGMAGLALKRKQA